MSVCIVTHCYAERLPQYAAFLRYQLSSLLLYPPKTPVRIVVCCVLADYRTQEILEQFMPRSLDLEIMQMSRGEVGRRAFGRNKASLESTEELIWHTDVDHLFRSDCIDQLMGQWAEVGQDESVILVYPPTLRKNHEYTVGDELIKRAEEAPPEELLDIEEGLFMPTRYTRAIGGVQIVRGSYAREHGYLNGTGWVNPRSDERPFKDFRDDVAFRKSLPRGSSKQIHLTGLYRIRHSEITYRG